MLCIVQEYSLCYDYAKQLKMDITAKIRQRIKAIRLQKGISQGQLARSLRVHPTYVSQIERGARNVSIKNVEKITQALGVSFNKLVQ